MIGTWISVTALASCMASAAEPVDFQDEIVPILTTYCAGCHNATDQEGEFSVTSYTELMEGSGNGPVVMASDSAASRLIRLITAQEEPHMPPEGEPRPDADQVARLRRWVDEGAVGPTEPGAMRRLITPRIEPSSAPKPITSMALSPDGQQLAIGRFRSVDLMTPNQQFIQRLDDHPGKVNAILFTPNGSRLFAATGITGLYGETWIWDVRRGEVVAKLAGHADTVYALACSPDGTWLATAGYDRQIHIWDLPEGNLTRTLLGHNGPVFDLAVTPDGRILASASADATVKIWDIHSGHRLDTLSQPLKEQLSVDISPDGKRVIAGGADNRLRMWQLISIDQPQINPLLLARYAHEQPIQRVRFSQDGRYLASVSADRTTKVWDAADLAPLHFHAQQGDMAEALAWQHDGGGVYVGRMDGGIERVVFEPQATVVAALHVDEDRDQTPAVDAPLQSLTEQEPNNDPDHAQLITVPAQIHGAIEGSEASETDVDQFRFESKQGQTWMIEVRAAREGSPLDSVVRVVDAEGKPIPRLLLRAMRDSYFTFRGKDSVQTGDFRLHNWEEMTLNQFLYAAGEVVKLYTYPRGPDSGFNVYPNFGQRHAFFDTTPVTHALQESCYVVTPYPPGTDLPANGLPVFPLFFENDDESQRRWGADSLLTFTAPADGQYVVQIEDVRKFQGSDFKYQLSVRVPRPDFRAKMLTESLNVPQGSGQKFGVELERIDGFQGEVTIEIEGLPDWLQVTQPLVVEQGHLRAWGTLNTRDDRSVPAVDDEVTAQVFATAVVDGQAVRHEVGDWGPIRAVEAATVSIDFEGNSGDGHGPVPVLEIQAGTTTTARIRIERHGESGPVSFGSEEAVVNAPHGVYVGNTGLNGVLITERETERTLFVHAEAWTPASERLVFVEASVKGAPTSRPMLLRVLPAGNPDDSIADASDSLRPK
jgi:hypothetical protein